MGMPEVIPSGIALHEVRTDLLMSIALQEASLAHVINAEGEKIQAAVKRYQTNIVADKINYYDLLNVNNSVAATIRASLELETVLLKKLKYIRIINGILDDMEQQEPLRARARTKQPLK